MTINAIENNTKVMTPEGYEGRVQVTRRERQLISDGKQKFVYVKLYNGHIDDYCIADLTLISEPELNFWTKEEFIVEVNSSHTVEELKTVINKMVVQLF